MKHPDHRGVSIGTIIMLTLTVLVLATSAAILPRLMGTADIRIDAGDVLAALDLRQALPALALRDIPITAATSVPELSPSESTFAALNTDRPSATPAAPTATPTATPTVTPVPGGSLTITLGGSVSVDDGIRKSAYYSDSGKYDFTEILSLLADEMQSDLTIMSLDNLADGSSKVSALNAPPAAMDLFSAAGVEVVSLGFPKAYDKGMTALKATIDAARDAHLTPLGAYATQQDADVAIMTINHVKVALVHGVYTLSSTSKKGLRNDGATYAVPVADEETMTRQIALARQRGADVVIATVHWGTDSFKLNTKMKNFAQALADAGADVIVGTGTTAVQTATWLTGKREDGSISQTLCAWSLGHLLSSGRSDSNVAGMLLQLQLSWDGTTLSFRKVSYTPTYIWRYKQEGVYHYRVVASDQAPPDGMDNDHIKYMEKARKNIETKLRDAPLTLR